MHYSRVMTRLLVLDHLDGIVEALAAFRTLVWLSIPMATINVGVEAKRIDEIIGTSFVRAAL